MSNYNNTNDQSDEDLPLASTFNQLNVQEYLTPRPQAQDLKPDQKLLALCPALDRRHFYSPATSDDQLVKEAAEEAKDERDAAIAACPRNKLQKFTAPLVTDLPWPEKHRSRQLFDQDLASIQTKLAHLTRPMDRFILDTLGDRRLDDEQTEEYLAFANDMVNYIQDISHHINDLRTQNLERAHGLDMLVKKNNRPTVVDTNNILERKKLLNSVRKNLYSSHRGRGHGRSHSGRNNQQQNYQGNNSNYQYSQQASSHTQSDTGGSRDFYNAQSNSNRGRGQGNRGRGQRPNNPQ